MELLILVMITVVTPPPAVFVRSVTPRPTTIDMTLPHRRAAPRTTTRLIASSVISIKMVSVPTVPLVMRTRRLTLEGWLLTVRLQPMPLAQQQPVSMICMRIPSVTIATPVTPVGPVLVKCQRVVISTSVSTSASVQPPTPPGPMMVAQPAIQLPQARPTEEEVG